jgi:hypothetical protein
MICLRLIDTRKIAPLQKPSLPLGILLISIAVLVVLTAFVAIDRHFESCGGAPPEDTGWENLTE